jgi:hypothetical protein
MKARAVLEGKEGEMTKRREARELARKSRAQELAAPMI